MSQTEISITGEPISDVMCRFTGERQAPTLLPVLSAAEAVPPGMLAATRCCNAASSIVGWTRFLPIISANRMDRITARQG